MPNVMVVDDAVFMRMKLTQLLTDSGYSVITADNGEEAIELYKTEVPECVLLDITMPYMDGLTALEYLREYDAGAQVTMVTAIGNQSVVVEALKAGAAGFVVKPFASDKILAAVKKMLSQDATTSSEPEAA